MTLIAHQHQTGPVSVRDSEKKCFKGYEFIPGNNVPRDYDYESYEILKGKIELKLLMTLGTDEIYTWLPGGYPKGNLFYVNEYSIVTKTHSLSTAQRNKIQSEEVKKLSMHAKNIRKAIETIPEAQKNVSNTKNSDKRQKIQFSGVIQDYISSLKQYSRKLSRLRPAYDQYAGRKRYLGEVNPRCNSLLELYANINFLREDEAVEKLKDKFSIDHSVFSDFDMGKTRWYFVRHSSLSNDERLYYYFKGPNELCLGAVLKEVDGGGKTLLPCTTWVKNQNENKHKLSVPFPKPYPLYNLDLICDANSDADIYLTDSIEIAYDNQHNIPQESWEETVWTSWYGEKDAVADVDWERLKGKNVRYVLTRHSGFNEQQIYATALAAYHAIKNIVSTISFINAFVVFSADNTVRYSRGTPKLISEKEFLQEAALCLGRDKVYSKVKSSSYALKTIADIEDIKEIDYLLPPVIPQNTVTLLEGLDGIGKTWLALSLGYSISVNKSTFSRWKPEGAKKVLYIDTQLGDNLFKRRLRTISEMYADKKAVEEDKESFESNFIWESIHSQMFNLSKKQDRDKIDNMLKEANNLGEYPENVSLLIFDDFSSLVDAELSVKSRKEIYQWLGRFNKNGCAVLCVNTCDKYTKVDIFLNDTAKNVIRVTKRLPQKLSNIAMTIKPEKGPDIYGVARMPFSIEMNPKSKNSKWKKVNAMTTEEENKLIIALDPIMIEKELADYMGLSLPTIKTRRKQLELSKTRS